MGDQGDVAVAQKPAAAFPVALVLAHIVCWTVLVAGIFVFVPRMKYLLADFGVDLPTGTIIALKVVDLVLRSPWVLAVGVAAIAAVDTALIASRDRNRPDDGKLWTLLWFLGLPMGLIAALVWAIAIPLANLLMRITG